MSVSQRLACSFRFLLAVSLLGMIVLAVSPSAAAPASGGATAAQAATTAEPGADKQIQALIDALRNPDTRAKFIDALEKANGAAGQAAAKAPENAGESGEIVSFGRGVAESTQAAAQAAARSAEGFFGQLAAVPHALSVLGVNDVAALTGAAGNVALAVVVSYGMFFLLGMLARGLFERVRRTAEEGLLRPVLLVVVSALIEAATVIIAWAVGYLLILSVFGQFGVVGIRQSLYLTAFLFVELFRALLRVVLSPSATGPRLVNVGDDAARLLYSRLGWIAILLGYGQLFVAPVLNQSVSRTAGQAISIVLALIALAIAVFLVARNRRPVRAWLLGETTDQRAPSRFAQVLARCWVWLAFAYFVFLFVVIVGRPADALLPVLGATGQVIAALVIGIGITGWMGRASRRGIRLPASTMRKMPMLESRLNAVVLRLLTVVRLAVFVGILALVLDLAGVIDIGAWFATVAGGRIAGAVAAVVVTLLIALAVWIVVSSWIEYRLNPDVGSVPTTREQTLLTLMRNAVTIAIVVIALMFALSEIGVNIAPLIASAGVVGLAIGFGAQKLVQDIITGIFIQLENAINVGDVVTAGGITGTAERLTIRSLSIRDGDGTYHIIPFSSVDMVANFMRGFSYAVCTIGVGYREDYDDVRDAMFEAFAMLRNDPEHSAGIIGDMAWDGITQFADSAVMVRARIKTTAGQQWGVGRAYNTYVKKVFDARDIDIPVPQRTILFGRDKKGNAPPAHIRMAGEGKTEGVPPVVPVRPLKSGSDAGEGGAES